jgi:formylglycine-generating enzyme required for sulfatase activity
VRKEGYDPFITDLVLAPGIGRTFEFKLTDPKDIVGNSPARITTKNGIRLIIVAAARSRPAPTAASRAAVRTKARTRSRWCGRSTWASAKVTNAQFRKFKESHNSGSIGNQSLDLDKQPVVRVTWDDAAEFCNWLSAQEGLPPRTVASAPGEEGTSSFTLITPVTNGYRLPTEAEWEFVARAAAAASRCVIPGARTCRWFPGSANWAGSEAAGLVRRALEGHRDEFPAASAPALFPPNAMGFYDFAGNVSEWVNDKYPFVRAVVGGHDPLGPDDSKGHTYRGSNWRTTATSSCDSRGAKAPCRPATSSVPGRAVRGAGAAAVGEIHAQHPLQSVRDWCGRGGRHDRDHGAAEYPGASATDVMTQNSAGRAAAGAPSGKARDRARRPACLAGASRPPRRNRRRVLLRKRTPRTPRTPAAKRTPIRIPTRGSRPKSCRLICSTAPTRA